MYNFINDKYATTIINMYDYLDLYETCTCFGELDFYYYCTCASCQTVSFNCDYISVLISIWQKQYLLPRMNVVRIYQVWQKPNYILRILDLNLEDWLMPLSSRDLFSVLPGSEMETWIASGVMKISKKQTWIGPESIFLRIRTLPSSTKYMK